MKKRTRTQYCSLEPSFPDQAFILYLFVLHEDKLLGAVPLDAIYQNLDEASVAVEQVIEDLGKTENIIISEECLMLPIKKKDLFPMKRDFWTKPTMKYDQHSRVQAFMPVIEHPSLFQLLVTPFVFDDDDKKWYFSATLPIYHTNSLAMIEKFMFRSDQVVEPRAKFSAIYSFGEKLQFNWKTKKVEKVQKDAEEMIGNMN